MSLFVGWTVDGRLAECTRNKPLLKGRYTHMCGLRLTKCTTYQKLLCAGQLYYLYIYIRINKTLQCIGKHYVGMCRSVFIILIALTNNL